MPHPQSDGITHSIVKKDIKNFRIDNFTIGEKYFESYMPYNWKGDYFFVRKSKDSFHQQEHAIKIKIIVAQTILLALFALISYFLSLRALRPMQEAIVKLDNFSKDLIHDLNTPITSILLNTKILERSGFKENKALSRIKRSAEDIGELHKNLNILLQEDTLLVKKENICEIVREVVSIQEKIYEDIEMRVVTSSLHSIVNRDALKQIVSNLLSNACKYNKTDGFVEIYVREKTLFIKDSGVGIRQPDKIFNRAYTEHEHGHGIGLDIVQRLCDVMEIKIGVTSKVNEGTEIALTFKH